MAYSNPIVGTKGKFTLIAPFTAAPDTEYEVVAVRSFVELTKSGADVFAIYYLPNGIEKTVFGEDSARGANIISLRDDRGQIIHLPDSYISSSPDLGGVPYSQRVLAVNLGPLPKSLALDDFKAQLVDYITSKLGVTAVIKEGHLKTIGVVTDDQNNANEQARLGRISHPDNPLGEITRLQMQNDELATKVDVLTQLAKRNNLL